MLKPSNMNYEIFSSNNCGCGNEGMKREGAPTKDFPQFSIGGSNDGAESSHREKYKNLKHEDFECNTKLC